MIVWGGGDGSGVTILHEKLLGGLRSVLTGLTSFKCSYHLLVFDKAACVSAGVCVKGGMHVCMSESEKEGVHNS